MISPSDIVSPKIAAFATKGSQTNDELRLRELLKRFEVEFLPYDKSAKRRSFFRLMSMLSSRKPDLLVMEGTGIGGGIACMLARLLYGTRYVVSSGDAVGPFIGAHHRWVGPVFAIYERLLCRLSAGFIGWTPYLVGRAMTFGAVRACTAPGWVLGNPSDEDAAVVRQRIREKLAIPPHAIVFGIAGALQWNQRKKYCYGMELVQAINQIDRDDVYVMIVGGGSGLERLREVAGSRCGSKVIFTEQVELNQVMPHLCAMDIASLPQSVDTVGSFRYTTKVSEYLAAGLPIVTTRIPMAYDLDLAGVWRLPGKTPWEITYIRALAALMQTVTPQQINTRRKRLTTSVGHVFDRDVQIQRVTAFIGDLLDDPSWQAESPRQPAVDGRAKSLAADSTTT